MPRRPQCLTQLGVFQEFLEHLGKMLDIVEIPHDQWNAAQFAGHMIEAGFELIEVPQTVNHLSEPLKELEAILRRLVDYHVQTKLKTIEFMEKIGI